jgi:SAM-dependent methyltransferase
MLQLSQRVLTCACMDAQRLALQSQSFDVALLAYVLFHCPEPIAALREAHRVLRGGGTIGVVTWGSVAVLTGKQIWTEELDALGASADARVDDASVSRHADMNTPEKLTALLHEAGFESAQARSEDFEFRWSARRVMTLQGNCGPPASRLESLAPALRDGCRRRVQRRLAQLDDAQRLCRLQVVSAVARKPPQS